MMYTAGMRIEPEQVLEQNGVTAQGGIEDSDVKASLNASRTIVIASTGVASIWMRLWRSGTR